MEVRRIAARAEIILARMMVLLLPFFFVAGDEEGIVVATLLPGSRLSSEPANVVKGTFEYYTEHSMLMLIVCITLPG